MRSSKSYPQLDGDFINSKVNVKQLQKIITRVMKKYNFHYYSLYKENPYPLTRKESSILNCFDNDFYIDKQTHGNLLVHMETLSSIVGLKPLSWEYNLKETLPEVWDYFISTGGRVGYSILYKTEKREKIICSFFRMNNIYEVNKTVINESELFTSTISIANQYSYLAEEGRDSPSLSSREKEILRWASEGKTSSDIASILHLSISTVNFHMRNSLGKLAVTNKVAAIAKAICFNMI
ncbi:helix-turn-helix domain-containing protein [Pantoea stewartii subsp. indologenes]|uniref:helix-turn-helix domain-containing protein n=1 Tax=Pantoea stewartii TaxID=66269 RepID=UPI003FA47CC7